MPPDSQDRLEPMKAGSAAHALSAPGGPSEDETSGDVHLLPATQPSHDLTGHAKGRSLAAGELLLDRFEIVRHLGSGGMGDVYEATDLLMGHDPIALKTIRPDLVADPEQLARFKNEVHLARKVSNPHVCRIHELFLTGDGQESPRTAFLTMELLEGTTLAEKTRSGPLAWSDARTIALEICAALEAIHHAGIIHRDLKGRNIMLASRNGAPCTVLMDFGIARTVRRQTGETSTALTQMGVRVGTPGYMAPEQYEGREISEASDIYSFGIVLHELVTGRRPSPERPSVGTEGSRKSIAPSASSPYKGVPRRIDKVITKCLERDPGRRYQTVSALKDAIEGRSLLSTLAKRPLAASFIAAVLILGLLLIPIIGERVRGILLSSSEKHIAILPFDVPGGSPEVEALGDGLMDSLAGDLANLDVVNRTLWVIPASEIRARKVDSASAAMREFGATIVVKGSFVRNDGGARLKLTLIDPKKTREIGFVDVANPSGDLAAMQREAIVRLGRLMNISVKDDLVRTEDGPGTGAAFEDYLAGLGYFQRYDKSGNLDLATASLESAVKKDPNFALGFARLAQVYLMRYRLDSNPQWLKQAEAGGKRAAQLDDRVPSTYVALAQVHEMTGNHDLAIQEFQRAASIDPKDAQAITGMAESYQNEGWNAQAEAAFVRAAALHPEDWNGYNDLGMFYAQIGRTNDAIAQFQRALDLTPDNAGVYSNLGAAYMDLDEDPTMAGKAEQALKRSIAISPTYGAYGNLGFLYSKQHRFPESIAATEKALQINDQDTTVWANLIAAYEWAHLPDKAAAARSKATSLLEAKLKINPQNTDAHAALAALRAKNGQRDKSLDEIQISLVLSPKSQYVLSQVADAYELLGDRKKAIKYLEQALANGLNWQDLIGDPDIQGVLQDPHFRIPGHRSK